MLEGCLILLVVLIYIGYVFVTLIPWWLVAVIIACACILGIFTEDDDY